MNPIIVGNWKMNETLGEALLLSSHIANSIEKIHELDIVIAPPSLFLYQIFEHLKAKPQNLFLAMQNTYWDEFGAYTGEVSLSQTKNICKYVIIGHSERRKFFGETDKMVNQKVRFALLKNVSPIICVGEEERFHLEDYYDREVSRMKKSEGILSQIDKALEGVKNEDLDKIVIAYEPVWAIGTGNNATGAYAAAICYIIKNYLSVKYSQELAKDIRVVYGGSVNQDNVREYMLQPSINGLLVGGESLKPKEFSQICRIAAEVKSGRTI